MQTVIKRSVGLLIGMLIFEGAVAAPYESGDVVVFVQRGSSPVAGMEVHVDGETAARTNAVGIAELELSDGRHRIQFVGDGSTAAELPLLAEEGTSFEVSVALGSRGREPQFQVRSFPVGQTAVLSGVVASEAGEPLRDAVVSVNGQPGTATTDADGRFELTVPRGRYTLKASHPRMQERRFTDVRALGSLSSDLELAVAARSGSGSGAIEEVVVVGRLVPNTPIAVERNSDSVLDALSEFEIEIAGDSTAADALQRVTGVTVQDDLVFVRGLGDRYSATFFNGAELPSPDPTRRAIGLDIFPTDLISGISVQKSYTADLPGDFSGGAVRLASRSVPDGFSGSFSASTGGNHRSTFVDGFTHAGGDYDWAGFDDGDRDIPDVAGALTNGGGTPLASLEDAQRETVARSLAEEFGFNLRGFELPADLDVDASISNRFSLGETDLGVSLAGLYDSEWRYVEEERAEIIADATGGEFVGESSVLERTENDIRAGAILNATADIGLDHTLTFTSLLSRESRKGTYFEEGFNRSDDRDFRRVILEYAESELFSNQLSGLHQFPDLLDSTVEWQATYSRAQRDEPGTREYVYSRPVSSTGPLRLATGPGEAGLPPLFVWEYLDEDTVDTSVDVSIPATLFQDITGEFRLGGRLTSRDRDFETTRWRYALSAAAGQDAPLFFPSFSFPSVEMILTPNRIGSTGFTVVNASSALAGGANADNYKGEQDIYAGYFMADFDFDIGIGEGLQVQAGMRVESGDLSVETDAIVGGVSRVGEIDETDYLPSLNMTLFINDASQLRLAASQTINRPQFRELSPTQYRDPQTRFEAVGNPGLEQAEVTSFDLRYEYYWSREEGVSIAAFYKDLEKPIEIVTIGGGSDDRGVRSFANAESGELYGVEVDGRVTMAHFEEVAHFLSDVYLMGNIGWFDSKVSVGAGSIGIGTNNDRQLQGQSPWVANLGLGYSNPSSGTDAILLFNMYGERIVEAGVNGAPDAKEQPRALLDLNLKQVLFDRWVVGLKFRNLLDSEFEVEQGSGVQRAFKSGREMTLSLSYEF